jgi:DNA ligase-1
MCKASRVSWGAQGKSGLLPDRQLARLEALGGEGRMLRRPGSRYESGRSATLLKVKTFHEENKGHASIYLEAEK